MNGQQTEPIPPDRSFCAAQQLLIDLIDVLEDLRDCPSLFGRIQLHNGQDLLKSGREGASVILVVLYQNDPCRSSVKYGHL